MYYLLKNLQGDVIAIVDKNANTVARYSYDAWGVPTATQIAYGNIAEINPFRYRSYYFDEEIEMYYLQSRYYDANVGRFINADDIGLYLSIFNSANFSTWHYCYNDPLNFTDECGYISCSSKSKIKSYVNETWIAWILNKFINEVTDEGRLDLIEFNYLGLEMQLFCEIATKKGGKLPSTSSIEASFKGVNFELAWGEKLDLTLGVSISNYTVSFLRGIDWKKVIFQFSFLI